MTAASDGNRPRIVIVTPVFNEAATLLRYERAVREVLLNRPEYDMRVLLVDDGSRDDSWKLITQICALDARFRGLRLSRNFGSHIALSAALHHVEGDAVAVLAADLQDPPETILKFLAEWRNGARVVWGRRRTRSDQTWRVIGSRIFETLTRRFAMPKESRFTTGSFLLIDRRVHECYRQFQEQKRVTFALVAWTGFEQAVVDYDRLPRLEGQSAWKLTQMLRATLDTFLSFSKVPFGIVSGIGASMFLLSVPVCGYLAACYAMGNPMPGWTSIMMTLIMLFGLQFMFMSLLGEYLSRIYSESVRRPLYFVSDDTEEASEQHSAAA